MEEKKNCPGGGTPGQQMALEGFEEPTPADSIIPQQQRISSFLSRGKENSISRKRLVNMTGFGERSVRLMIQRERLNGIPILSDNETGYFLPATPEEKERFVRSMRHRAVEILRSATRIEKTEIEGG